MGQPCAAWHPPASVAYRVEWALERIRDRFWVIPAVLLVAGAVLAVLTVQARTLGVPAAWRTGFSVTPGEAAGFLGIIASSTLTFLGVVFTLTLVALQLASSQLSPRVIRNFVRSGVTKVAFGIMLATFSYSVTVLVLAGGQRGEADSRSVTVALALVAASLAIFVGYVAATVRLLQVVSVIAAVARQTLAAIDESVPPDGAYRLAGQPAECAPSRTISLPLGRRPHRRTGHGVLLGVDHGRLTRLASRHGCVLELLVQVGKYVPAGSPVVAVHTAGGRPAGPGRAGRAQPGRGPVAVPGSSLQDPAAGRHRQPGALPRVQSAHTAVQVIDRLEEILLDLGRRPDRSPFCADQAGTVRLIEPVRDWGSYLDLAFSEIIRYGSGLARRWSAGCSPPTRRCSAGWGRDGAPRCGPGRRRCGRSRRGRASAPRSSAPTAWAWAERRRHSAGSQLPGRGLRSTTTERGPTASLSPPRPATAGSPSVPGSGAGPNVSISACHPACGRVAGSTKSSGSHQPLTRTRKSSSTSERAVRGPVGVVRAVEVERDGQRVAGRPSRRRHRRCPPV